MAFFYFYLVSCFIFYLKTKKELKKQEKIFLSEFKYSNVKISKKFKEKKVTKEVLSGCRRHNFLALNASISFFTLFALIPLILLIFFFLSQWLASSSFALSHLTILTSHLLPEINERIMNEVYKVSSTKLF